MQQPQPLHADVNALIALYNARRYAEVENHTRALLGQYPDFGFGWKLLGGSLQMQGKDSLHALQKAAELLPDDSGAHFDFGNALKDSGQLDDAAASYRRVLVIKPDFVEAYDSLSIVLKELGQFDAAQVSHRRALQLKHNFAEAHNNQGVVFLERRQYDGAVVNFRRALHFKPDFARAHNNLGLALQGCGLLDDAVASFHRALQLNPDSFKVHSNLGNALKDLGQLDHAEASYRRALEIKPDFAEAYNNLLFCLSHSQTVDAKTLFSEHCRFGEQFEAPQRAHWSEHTNTRDPERLLHIGFVSADLRGHPVASFIEPVLAHLSSCPQLSLHAYSNHPVEDDVTQRLQRYLTHWHRIAGMSDNVLAQQIRADGIDILIDLSGHTGKNRLLAFAQKPAPVQVSWMGYPGTTGLTAMDYYLADRFFLPSGQFDNQFTEKIVHLPANAPFLPSRDAPPVNTLPALGNGYMTFGSFNRLSKISRPVIALWARLLCALPDSRMLLGGMPEDGKFDALIEGFVQEGIAWERLDFHARSDTASYLSLHRHVDICLDTFPYNGGTTSLHALWMGVPTLTLAGDTAAGRQGASIMGHVGLEAFIAYDAADFVRKGLSWSDNLAALSDFRTGLRERFAQSAVGQPVMVAEGLQRALRIMWRRWCEGLPPGTIDVSDNKMNQATNIAEN